MHWRLQSTKKSAKNLKCNYLRYVKKQIGGYRTEVSIYRHIFYIYLCSVWVSPIRFSSVRFGSIRSDSVPFRPIRSDSLFHNFTRSDSVRFCPIHYFIILLGPILSDSVRFTNPPFTRSVSISQNRQENCSLTI